MYKLCSSHWDGFFDSKRLLSLKEIYEATASNDTVPYEDEVLSFTRLRPDEIKVVILGQDPYYSVYDGIAVANGRAFQPRNLVNWGQTHRQVSVKNILRLVHKSLNDITAYEDILSYKQVVAEIDSGAFGFKQPPEWFNSLERQGVLWLNTAFTTLRDRPAAHTRCWKDLVKDLISFIDNEAKPLWFLLGAHAISFSELLDEKRVFSSRHPMLCAARYEDDFLRNNCFLETKEIINWLG